LTFEFELVFLLKIIYVNDTENIAITTKINKI
jgi:hypothetical protein